MAHIHKVQARVTPRQPIPFQPHFDGDGEPESCALCGEATLYRTSISDPKTQTTFSVSKTDADALHQAAMDRGETSQTILRQVIEVARRANPRGR